MTISETKVQRDDWIKTLKVGDEVCITNTYNISVMLGFSLEVFSGNKSENTAPVEVCEITKVRGILDDGAIVVGNIIYKSDGTQENKEDRNAPEIYPVTDELREKTWRLKFSNDISNISWKKVSSDGICKIIDIINEEIKRIDEEEKARRNEERRANMSKEYLAHDSIEDRLSNRHLKNDTTIVSDAQNDENNEGGNDDGAES